MTGSAVIERLVGDSRRDPLFALLFWGTVTTFIAMVLCAWLQVISRYFFNFPLGWTEELARVMMFWFTYLSVGALVRRRRLMAVDAFTVQMPHRARLATSSAMHLFSAATLCWLAYLSVRLMELASGQQSTALAIPYALIYLSLPVGLAAAVVYLVAIAIADFRSALAGSPGERAQLRDD